MVYHIVSRSRDPFLRLFWKRTETPDTMSVSPATPSTPGPPTPNPSPVLVQSKLPCTDPREGYPLEKETLCVLIIYFLKWKSFCVKETEIGKEGISLYGWEKDCVCACVSVGNSVPEHMWKCERGGRRECVWEYGVEPERAGARRGAGCVCVRK